MPVKALFSPFNEVIFRGISKYHPLKIANSLIFNELRSVGKIAFCMHYSLHTALFIYTACTVCTNSHAQA